MRIRKFSYVLVLVIFIAKHKINELMSLQMSETLTVTNPARALSRAVWFFQKSWEDCGEGLHL